MKRILLLAVVLVAAGAAPARAQVDVAQAVAAVNAPDGNAAASPGQAGADDAAAKIEADGAPMPLPREMVMSDGTVGPIDPLYQASLMFSQDEIRRIIDAATIGLRDAERNKRLAALRGKNNPLLPPLDPNGKKPDGTVPTDPEAKPAPMYPTIPLNRQISLAGVFYRSPSDWIVWLNGRKVTPHDRPRELVGIKVERDRAHIKWFDIGMGKVISITLRPRQTYDIVSGVLLPG